MTASSKTIAKNNDEPTRPKSSSPLSFALVR